MCDLSALCGILFSHKKEWILVQAAKGMILESIVLSERSQPLKAVYCMIPLM